MYNVSNFLTDMILTREQYCNWHGIRQPKVMSGDSTKPRQFNFLNTMPTCRRTKDIHAERARWSGFPYVCDCPTQDNTLVRLRTSALEQAGWDPCRTEDTTSASHIYATISRCVLERVQALPPRSEPRCQRRLIRLFYLLLNLYNPSTPDPYSSPVHTRAIICLAISTIERTPHTHAPIKVGCHVLLAPILPTPRPPRLGTPLCKIIVCPKERECVIQVCIGYLDRDIVHPGYYPRRIPAGGETRSNSQLGAHHSG